MAGSDEDEMLDVIIIGGGVSGLRAAAVLAAAKIRFTLLEASDRLGGRVKTDPVLGDLGATWFHGTEGNIAYNLATMARIGPIPPPSVTLDADHPLSAVPNLTVSAEISSINGSDSLPQEGARTDGDGERDWKMHPAVQYLGAMDLVRVRVDGSRELIPRTDAHPALRTLAFAAMERDRDRRNTRYRADVSQRESLLEHLPSPGPPLLRELFELWEAFDASVIGSPDDTSAVSLLRNGDYVELRGDHVLPNNGMTRDLVVPLATTVPHRTKRTGARVSTICWGAAEHRAGVTVTLADASTPLRARVVLWTPSVNVMRAWDALADDAGTFEPPLPASKRAALASTGMNTVAKVITSLATPPAASTHSDHAFGVIWESAAATAAAPWARGVHAVTLMSTPPRACMWLTGTSAEAFEAATPAAREKQASVVLSHVLGERVIVTRAVCGFWGSNPLVRGGYSYPRVGAKKGRIYELARPLEAVGELRVAFAGEATHPTFYSTLHGAIESGEREARRCIRFLRGQEWREIRFGA